MNHINPDNRPRAELDRNSRRDRFSGGASGRQLRLGGAALARRRVFVALAKRALPLGAIIILLALVLVPSLRGTSTDRISYHMQDVAAPTNGSHMLTARFHGVDQSGEPYTITASSADQRGANLIALTAPIGDLTQKSGNWLMLKADHGVYDQRTGVLDLDGGVTLYRNDGTVVTAPRAKIDLKIGTASSADPVQVQGPFGTLTSRNGFSLVDRGALIDFAGQSALTLTQVQ